MRAITRAPSLGGSVRFVAGEWYCTRHLPSLKMIVHPGSPEEGAVCCISGCPSVVEGTEVVRELHRASSLHRKQKKCALSGCEKPPSGRSKYCSRNCSNKNARARYLARKDIPKI